MGYAAEFDGRWRARRRQCPLIAEADENVSHNEVRFGSETDICDRVNHVRLGPMSATPCRSAQTASVQLSENANADVEKGRPSRSRFQDCPLASMPLRMRRVPSAGINTVHTP